MHELTELRAELDRIDRELVALFEKRMAVSREVAAYKMAKGLPVLDASREAQVIASRQAMLRDPRLSGAAAELFKTVMALSRREQERVMEEDQHA